jgi:diguanylate cyclase (GGDEF)-like protein
LEFVPGSSRAPAPPPRVNQFVFRTLRMLQILRIQPGVCYKRRILTRPDRPAELPVLKFAVSLLSLVVLIHLVAAGAFAQQFSFQHYEQDEGLKNHDVFRLMQDKTGFLWSATENGLFRYDGTEFRRFGAADGIEESLVIDVYEDASGRIWTASNDHLYYFADGYFQAVPTTLGDIQLGPGQRLTSVDPRHILFLNRNVLMLAQPSDELRRWTIATYFNAPQMAAHPELSHLHNIFVDLDGTLWLGCADKLCRVKGNQIDVLSEQQGVAREPWLVVYRDHQGLLWIRNTRHISVLVPGSGAFIARDITPGNVSAFAGSGILTFGEDRDGRILTQTSNGIARWNGDRWQAFDRSNGLDFSDISTILTDQQGSLWFSTRGHGLRRWLGYDEIENWTVSQGLGNDIVWCIFRDRQNHHWIGDDLQVGQFNEQQKRILPALGLAADTFQKIDGITQSLDDSFWLVNISGHVLHSNPLTERFREFAKIPDTARLFADSSHRIWFLSREGLYVIKSPVVSPNVERLKNPLTATDSFVDAAEAPDGTLWFLSDHHLYRLSGDKWTEIRLDHVIIQGQMRGIAVASDGTLWIGGGLPGLYHLSADGDRSRTLAVLSTPEIISTDVQFVRFDQRGWLWVGTDVGVNVSDGNHWKLLTQRDGLISNDTNEGAFFSDSDGSVWIGVNGGAVHLLQPENVFSQAPLHVTLQSATLGDRKLNLTGSKNIWRWRDAPLDIEFTSLSYDRQRSMVFRYRLLGLEPNWNQTSAHHLHYPAMPPGGYRFEVQAFDPDQQRQSTIASVDVLIRPPWWRTRAFYAILAILSFSFCVWIWHWREGRLIKRQQLLEQLIAQRTSELEAEKTELLMAREALHHQATHDALTDLWNRSAIIDILQREMERAHRDETSLAVVLADIDYFKKINDTHGHLAGDLILRDAARRMAQNIRPTDFIGRYGGEEFLIVLSGLAEGDPTARLSQLHEAISQKSFLYLTQSILITSSFGVAWIEPETSDVEEIIRRADEALYDAKASGRNRVVFYSKPLHLDGKLDTFQGETKQAIED